MDKLEVPAKYVFIKCSSSTKLDGTLEETTLSFTTIFKLTLLRGLLISNVVVRVLKMMNVPKNKIRHNQRSRPKNS